MSQRLALTLSLLLAPALGAQTSQDASFGTWPFLVGNMDPQIPTLVATAVANDLDTIYVSVYRATGPQTGTLWITDTAGRWNSAWGPVRTGGVGIDLTALIQQAHAANVQVVGVLKCFDATVEPSSAAHRAYLLQIVDYLLSSYDPSGKPYYDLDGLALDYVRYVGSGCSGKDPTLVTNFVRDVKQRLGVRQLHAYLLAGRYTFQGPSYSGPFNSYSSVRSTNRNCYGQDWEQMSQWVDVMIPMAYTANGSIYSTYSQHKAYVQTVASYCRMACQIGGFPSRRVSPAIRCWTDGSETATTQTIDASITGALAGGGDGYQAFRYGTMQSNWWPTLRAYARPLPNRPVADLQLMLTGLSTTANATGSKDPDQPSSTLQVRYDWGNDGVYETQWLGNAQANSLIALSPGGTTLGLEVRDADGNLGATTRFVSVPQVLSLSPSLLSAAAGGSVQMTLSAGPATAGSTYLLTGSLSGSSPGVPFAPGLVLPLNIDALTIALVQAVNTPLFQNSFTTIDPQGQVVSTFTVPPAVLTSLVGRTFTWAGLALDPQGKLSFVTNAGTTWIWP